MKVRILGIGSPSGDDQAGWLVIDALKERFVGNAAYIVVDKLDRPGTALIPLLQDADHVILIDAMQCGGAAGTFRRFDRQGWPAYRGGLSSHGIGVLDTLAVAEALDGLPPMLELYGIEIASADPGAAPGPRVQAAACILAAEIAASVSQRMT